MRHFYVFNINKKRRSIFIFCLAFCTALILLINPTATLQIFTISNKAESVITKGNKKEKDLALTFNISWGEEKVYDILKALKNNDTRATFFISGEWAERHPQIVESIQKDKHEIAMLGYRYKNYIEQDVDQVRKDMIYAKKVFDKMDLDATYIRPPSGLFNKEIIELAESLDLEVVHWSVNPNDWKNPGVKEIEAHIMDKAGKGDIILLHASDSAKQTADVLNIIIPKYQSKKFSFVTISELIHEVSVKEKLIE